MQLMQVTDALESSSGSDEGLYYTGTHGAEYMPCLLAVCINIIGIVKGCQRCMAAAVYQQKSAVAGGSSSDASLGDHHDPCIPLDVQLVWHAN